MTILSPNFITLFVSDPLASGTFYAGLLGLQPVKQSPTFVMFAFPNEICLGLWSNKTAQPKVTAPAGGSEIAFTEKNVDAVYAHWKKLGVTIAQEPTNNEAGRTFVALDPDGHRIRVFWQEKEN